MLSANYLHVIGLFAVAIAELPGSTSETKILNGLPALVTSCSYVVRSERLSLPLGEASTEEDVRGVLLEAATFGEGKTWIPFESLNDEFTRLHARSRALPGSTASDRVRTQTFVEHKIVASDQRQVMSCVSEGSLPTRVRNAVFELSYFAATKQLNIEASPSSTIFYSLDQLYQPLPTGRSQIEKLSSWRVVTESTGEEIALIRIEKPNLANVRYSIATVPSAPTRPLACWLRTEADPTSILFSVYSYAVATDRDREPHVLSHVLQIQCAEGRMEVERLTIREFSAGVADSEAQLSIEPPESVFDLRQTPTRRLASWKDLPIEARQLLQIEER